MIQMLFNIYTATVDSNKKQRNLRKVFGVEFVQIINNFIFVAATSRTLWIKNYWFELLKVMQNIKKWFCVLNSRDAAGVKYIHSEKSKQSLRHSYQVCDLWILYCLKIYDTNKFPSSAWLWDNRNFWHHSNFTIIHCTFQVFLWIQMTWNEETNTRTE